MNLTESCHKSDIVSVKDSSCIIHCTSNNVDYRMKKGSEKLLCRFYLRFEYMNTNISKTLHYLQRENRFLQILFFAILSLSGKLIFSYLKQIYKIFQPYLNLLNLYIYVWNPWMEINKGLPLNEIWNKTASRYWQHREL